MAPYLCSAESAISTCNSTWPEKAKKKYKKPIKLRRFTYSDLESSTNNFSPRNLLGKGSHGAVFKAVLDNGALIAAVKKNTTTVTLTSENEIEILSKIRSRRIVNLIGYAVDSGERKLLLVVELMPNGSLYDLIHKKPKPPSWSTRVKFSLQVAKAIQALHSSNPPIIHRDIKSSNVLIDERENARLSDFGLALRGHVEDVRVTSTPPAGTLGYLDPCYLAPGDVSTKNDVFSFGILLLEIISGRRAVDVKFSPPFILEWALPVIKSGVYEQIYDRRIRGLGDPTVCKDLAVLAARCVRSTAEKRPSMVEIVQRLTVIYKRVMVGPIWSNLRCGVKNVDVSQPFDGGSDGTPRLKRSFSGRRRKLSYAPRSELVNDRIGEEVTRGSQRVVRSRSVGSTSSSRGEIKVGPEEINNGLNNNKNRAQVTVKMPIVKLSKSRSMSVLSSNGSRNSPRINKELDVFSLSVNKTSATCRRKAELRATIRELSNGIGNSSSSSASVVLKNVKVKHKTI